MADIMQRFYGNGRVAEQWDDNTSTYTAYDASGVQTANRPYTADESAAAATRATKEQWVTNQLAIQTRATNALTTNENYLAIASPTSAQAITQVAVVTRECSAIIRLLLGLLDSTAGT